MDWLGSTDEDRIFLSVVSLAELRHGVERMADGARRRSLDDWLTGHLPDRFADRILPIDAETADLWGRIIARGQAAGRPLSVMDAFIASTCERHRLTLVTRNTSDFELADIRLLNPWTGV